MKLKACTLIVINMRLLAWLTGPELWGGLVYRARQHKLAEMSGDQEVCRLTLIQHAVRM